jgi:hypothetical protein
VAAAVGVVAEETIMKQKQFARRLGALAAFTAITFSTVLLAAPAVYPTPDAAATAFIAAVQMHDDATYAKILGADWKTYVPTGDIDREDVDAFLASYKESHKIVADGNVQRLEVGHAGWTMPIPIVKSGSGWTFDLKAGAKEMRTRQIGRNELSAQQAVLAYYDAQRDYASADHNNDGIHEYAQKFFSTPGKQDGLYWEVKNGEAGSPLGPQFADSGPPKGEGYHGYHYRILTAQGPSAPGGAYDYVVGGRMRNGFAAIAWPVRYGETGVMTFMVSHDGEVFEKDLGKDTAAAAAAMKIFDPDSSWHEDDDLDK